MCVCVSGCELSEASYSLFSLSNSGLFGPRPACTIQTQTVSFQSSDPVGKALPPPQLHCLKHPHPPLHSFTPIPFSSPPIHPCPPLLPPPPQCPPFHSQSGLSLWLPAPSLSVIYEISPSSPSLKSTSRFQMHLIHSSNWCLPAENISNYWKYS